MWITLVQHLILRSSAAPISWLHSTFSRLMYTRENNWRWNSNYKITQWAGCCCCYDVALWWRKTLILDVLNMCKVHVFFGVSTSKEYKSFLRRMTNSHRREGQRQPHCNEIIIVLCVWSGIKRFWGWATAKREMEETFRKIYIFNSICLPPDLSSCTLIATQLIFNLCWRFFPLTPLFLTEKVLLLSSHLIVG